MTFEVGLAFFVNKIVRRSKLCMDIVTRNENNIEPLVVVGLLRAIDLKWFIIRQINAEESSLFIVSNSFESPLECFRCWCEINPVSFIALVVRKKSLARHTILREMVSYDILHESRVVLNFPGKVVFYCESEFEFNFV